MGADNHHTSQSIPFPLINRAEVVLPKEPGIYALHLKLRNDANVQIGQLGEFYLLAGDYWYVGSAHGPGGLRARLGRHLAGTGKTHWHIDCLRKVAEVESYFLVIEDQRLKSAPSSSIECVWSKALARLSGAEIPIRGFGSSDCRAGCQAHLIRLTGTHPEALVYETLAQVFHP
jgi:Uri superfamily endonuclease